MCWRWAGRLKEGDGDKCAGDGQVDKGREMEIGVLEMGR